MCRPSQTPHLANVPGEAPGRPPFEAAGPERPATGGPRLQLQNRKRGRAPCGVEVPGSVAYSPSK